QVAVARGRALLVERTAREPFPDVRPLLHGEEGREHLLAGGVEQERGLAVLTRAADRADEVPEESARQVGGEGHRRLLRRHAPRAEARERASSGGAPDARGVLELGGIAREREPVVALHVLALLGEERAAHGVAGRGVAGEEAERVAVHAGVALAVDARALRVADTRID